MTLAVVVLLVAMLGGIPVAFAILMAALSWFLFHPTIPDGVLVQSMVSTLQSFPLLALPFFVLAGVAMVHGGLAARVVDLVDAFVGHRRGGLAQVLVLNSLVMGGMSGTATADAAVDSKIVVPEMTKKGYDLGFSAALSASSGVVAALLPPSLGAIIYGLLAQVSVGHLFVACIVPAALCALALCIAAYVVSVRRGYGAARARRLPTPEILARFRAALPALMMPVLLLVGLRIGVFTPTELGAVAAVYAIVVGMITRDIKISHLGRVLQEAAVASAIVMIVLATAAAFATVVIYERVPHRVFEAISSVSDNPAIVLLIIIFTLLAIGTFMEGLSLLVIVAPIIAALATQLSIDPVQLGVVVVLAIVIGGFTPPVGSIMFTVCSMTGCTIERYTRQVVPFVAVVVVVLLLTAFVPALTVLPVRLFF